MIRKWLSDWWNRHIVGPDPDPPCQLTPAWVLVGYDPATGKLWELRDIAALGPVQRADLLSHLYHALAPLTISLNRGRPMSQAEIQAAWDSVRRYPKDS